MAWAAELEKSPNTSFGQAQNLNRWEEEPQDGEVLLKEPILSEDLEENALLESEVEHDRSSRTFRMQDGSYLTRVYTEPLTFTNSRGNEKDIDNTLKKSWGSYKNTAGSFDVVLPAEGEGVKVTKDKATLELVPQFGALANSVVTENAIRYNNVADGVDLQYTVHGDALKEDIILNRPVTDTVFRYTLNGKHLTFTMENNILNVFYKEETEPVMTLTAPVMTDASGEMSTAILLELEERDGASCLLVKPDADWLDAPERAYPVTVDPRIALDTSNLEWHLVENGVGIPGYPAGPDVDHTSNPYLYVGWEKGNLTGVTGLTYGTTESYLKINHDFTQGMPDNAIITATLNGYKYAGSPSQPRSRVYCKMVMTPWRGSYTWNNKPLQSNIIADPQDVSGGNQWVQWDISDAVRQWMRGSPNYGLGLIPEYLDQDAVVFSGPGNAHGNQKMYLDIYWTVPDAVDEDLPLNAPDITLRALTKSHYSGMQTLSGVFADGVVRPTFDVSYRLNNVDTGMYTFAEYGRIYPESDLFLNEADFTMGWFDLRQSNWQSKLFKSFEYNTVYNVYTVAHKDGTDENGNPITESTPEGKSDDFIVYRFTESDTLPYVAKFYGVTVDQLVTDNRPQDYLAFPGNTFFIRNPQKNATIPYTRPDNLTLEQMRDHIYASLGRGMYSEFDLEPVNMNTGNFWFESVDAENTEYDGTFALTRTYNSIGLKNPGVFGRGWSFESLQTITGRENGDLVYHAGDGKQLVFEKNGGGYTSPAGYNLELKKVSYTGAREHIAYEIKDADNTVYAFDLYGLLRDVTTQKGLVTTVNYDKEFNLNSITTGSGRTYAFQVNGDGLITKVTLPNQGVLQYEYQDGNLVRFINADGDVVRYAYDGNSQMTEWYDGNGNCIIRNEYDSQGRVVKQTDAAGGVSTLSYSNGKTVMTDAEGNVTAYGYDSTYRTTSIEDGGEGVQKAYNAQNQLSSVTEKTGLTTEYEYDSKGNLTKEVRSDGAYREVRY
ncbi:MAG: DNRLRE domain-containing protein, partial [Clostridiales bacterium]|nr:DNRLRE domain-containing protein [Clostridiales bacterium]